MQRHLCPLSLSSGPDREGSVGEGRGHWFSSSSSAVTEGGNGSSVHFFLMRRVCFRVFSGRRDPRCCLWLHWFLLVWLFSVVGGEVFFVVFRCGGVLFAAATVPFPVDNHHSLGHGPAFDWFLTRMARISMFPFIGYGGLEVKLDLSIPN